MVIYIDNYDHIFLILVQVKPFSSHPHPNSPQKWFFFYESHTHYCVLKDQTLLYAEKVTTIGNSRETFDKLFD